MNNPFRPSQQTTQIEKKKKDLDAMADLFSQLLILFSGIKQSLNRIEKDTKEILGKLK